MKEHGVAINGNWLIFFLILGFMVMYILFGKLGLVAYICSYVWAAISLLVCFIGHCDHDGNIVNDEDNHDDE